jgi:hypothetical protein
MALIKLGPMVGGISGSIAATTFARNRAGYYARARTKPKIPVSIKRDAVQDRLTAVIDYWKKTFTTAQRLLWTQKAQQAVLTNKVGDAYVPTGLNLFVRANTQLLATNQALVTVPPLTPIAPILAPVLGWTTLVGISITGIGEFDSGLSGDVQMYWTLSLPQSKNFYKGPWETAYDTTLASLAALPLLILASASLIPKTRCFFKFNAVLADGSTSAPMITYCDVGTPA